MPTIDLFGLSADTWKRRRDSSMIGARNCRAALTDPAGCWKCAPDDDRVKRAVRYWVDKARDAHAIAMGRKPLNCSFLAIAEGRAVLTGPLYAIGAAA